MNIKASMADSIPSISSADVEEEKYDTVNGDVRPTKRRRLSASSSDIVSSQVPKNLPKNVSRIRPRSKAQLSQSFELQETELSNGKIVDAKSSFATINVSPWLIASLAAMVIRRPTAIQKSCIPQILDGMDVIGGSKTGSGKTVAFAVPILQRWAEDPMGIFAVVLTPTRYASCRLRPYVLLNGRIENWHFKFTSNSMPFLHRKP